MSYVRNLVEYLDATCARLETDKLAFADETERLSYGALQKRTFSVAAAIQGAGCGTNQPVAVLVERSAESVAAMLGVLRAGCYYAPLDADMPAERLEKILRRLQPTVLLCADRSALKGLNSGCPVLTFSECAAAEAGAWRERATLDSDPAYVIFTSGSTGEPKGIAVSHRSVIDFTEWLAETCGFREADVFGNQAPFYFDLSVKDLYQTLKHGASCHILPKKLFSFPLLLCQALREKEVTALNWATSAFALLASSGAFAECVPEKIRKVTAGGEAMQARHAMLWQQALSGVEITNLYGPTEVCVDCTAYRLGPIRSADELIPIGSACRNKEVFLLTEEGREAAAGEVGEICVAGSGLALGYFGEEEKSASVFVQDPRETRYRRLIYRTGDLAVRGEDGLLYFRARRDGQIKHQGYRIELGEIEAVVLSLDAVTAAACLFDREADRILCFYEGGPEGRLLARELRAKLPKYMVPNIYRQLSALPYNANGKIDRVALMESYRNEAH